MKISQQITFSDIDPEYKAFVDKFKPKKTTDDCYTPQNIYDVVLEWAVREYAIDPDNIIRPFWPDGDYEAEDYPEGCTVVDNPPFSIITRICRTYCNAGIKFFLFAPYLTNFQTGKRCDVTHIITGSSITYENGAKVDTAFVTNLDPVYRCRTAPDLGQAIKIKDTENIRKNKSELPKYKYPDNIVTAAMLGYMSKHGIDLRIMKRSAMQIRVLDAMRGGAE